MKVEPAHIDQLVRGLSGRMVPIGADAGGVADDLRRIDPGLKVRFAEAGRPPFWAVYHESEDGRTTELVLTCTAYQGHTGVWQGLDQRVVQRVREIDPANGYDYAAEVEKQNRQAAVDKRKAFAEKVGPIGELAAFATRKDLGVKRSIPVGDKGGL